MIGHKLDEETARKLWTALCSDGQMEARIDKILSVRPAKQRAEAVLAFCRIMYEAGAMRGYGLAVKLYADPEDDPED
jgi:hypothetical protein